jgi:TrmH family RNA methyltransferase
MITSRDNERLRRVRKLLGARKHRDAIGLFACEGEDLVAAAREAGIEPVDLLVAGENVAPGLLASVSTLPHPARVIGVYAREALPTTAREVCLGLWRVADPGNVGTILRSADAFGACVALSDGCADPLSPKALRASAGAIFRVPLLALDDAPEPRIALVAHGGEPLSELALEPPLTLLLGAEREGLPTSLVTDRYKATIVLPGDAESLNVAAAAAIALYEASRRSAGG